MRLSSGKAFTLVELLCVIAIVGLLAGIAMVSYPNIRYKADMAAARSNVREIVVAMNVYANDNKGLLPSTRLNNGEGDENEIVRLRYLYIHKYLTDPKVFVNPVNARDGARGLGKDVFGAGNDCYFAAHNRVVTGWVLGTATRSTPVRLMDGSAVPVVWDQRADRTEGLNRVRNSAGEYAGHFGYLDGTVLLLSPPQRMIRE